jgi:hypothetical protein
MQNAFYQSMKYIILLALLLTQLRYTNSTVITVSPRTPNEWYLTGEGVGSFTNSSFITPPLGIGYVNLTVTSSDSSNRIQLATKRFSGTTISNIAQMSYMTYLPTGNNDTMDNNSTQCYISLKMDIQLDLRAPASNQGKLIHTVDLALIQWNTWQLWDMFSQNATWYFSSDSTFTDCLQSDPCTLSQLYEWFPRLGIRKDDGALELEVSEDCPPYSTILIDHMVYRLVNDQRMDFDFEPGEAIVTVDSTSTDNDSSYIDSNDSIHLSPNILLLLILQLLFIVTIVLQEYTSE